MTFGCHSCNVDISQYSSYEESPCSTCKLTKESYFAHPVEMFESIETAEDPEQLESIIRDEDEDPLADFVYDLSVLEQMKKVCENQIFTVASGVVLKLLAMAKKRPLLVEVVIKKLQHPHMSYSEIGASLSKPCLKQNILHHLKQAVKLFPELKAALITDTRSNGGHYALQTVADKYKQDATQNRLRELIYGNDANLKAMTIKEINEIFKSREAIQNSIITDFDFYTNTDFDKELADIEKVLEDDEEEEEK